MWNELWDDELIFPNETAEVRTPDGKYKFRGVLMPGSQAIEEKSALYFFDGPGLEEPFELYIPIDLVSDSELLEAYLWYGREEV